MAVEMCSESESELPRSILVTLAEFHLRLRKREGGREEPDVPRTMSWQPSKQAKVTCSSGVRWICRPARGPFIEPLRLSSTLRPCQRPRDGEGLGAEQRGHLPGVDCDWMRIRLDCQSSATQLGGKMGEFGEVQREISCGSATERELLGGQRWRDVRMISGSGPLRLIVLTCSTALLNSGSETLGTTEATSRPFL